LANKVVFDGAAFESVLHVGLRENSFPTLVSVYCNAAAPNRAPERDIEKLLTVDAVDDEGQRHTFDGKTAIYRMNVISARGGRHQPTTVRYIFELTLKRKPGWS
jgi:hypothetical protein